MLKGPLLRYMNAIIIIAQNILFLILLITVLRKKTVNHTHETQFHSFALVN
jgi:hypothetical protein